MIGVHGTFTTSNSPASLHLRQSHTHPYREKVGNDSTRWIHIRHSPLPGSTNSSPVTDTGPIGRLSPPFRSATAVVNPFVLINSSGLSMKSRLSNRRRVSGMVQVGAKTEDEKGVYD